MVKGEYEVKRSRETKAILHAMIDKDISMNDLAKHIGVSISYASMLVNGRRDISTQASKAFLVKHKILTFLGLLK